MNNETPTPRTDRLQRDLIYSPAVACANSMADFACQLERELAEAQRKAKALDWLLVKAPPSRTVYDNGGFFCESLYTLDAIETAMKKDNA